MTPKEARDVLNGDWSNSTAPLEDCHICQRFQPLLWHCTAQTILDRAHCRRAQGDGVWVCFLCEEAIHRWMKQNPGETAGADAVTSLLGRLSQRLLGPRRKYRKRKELDND